MEFWNLKNLPEPPTHTYKSKPTEIDINHLKDILRDGIDFFNKQHLISQELALLTRVIYRMKAKLRNCKDFKFLERVKRDIIRFTDVDISNKLVHLTSLLPSNLDEHDIFLPTKNMVDFILVRLQGIGKILCRIMELCRLSAQHCECRFRLGHFWQLAVISMGIVSRIHVLLFHVIEFTCVLYVRLLPFSHKLKNPGVNWLPEDYVFPKDLKEWLNVDWDKLTEVIEIKDSAFDESFFDLCDDSDDDIQYCNEYIELDEDDVEIIEDLKQSSGKTRGSTELENSVIILRGFATDCIDTGEVILSSDEDVGAELNPPISEQKIGEAAENLSSQGQDVGEIKSSSNVKISETTSLLEHYVKDSSDKKKEIMENVLALSNEGISLDHENSIMLLNGDENESLKASSFRTVDIAENSPVELEVISSDEDTLNRFSKRNAPNEVLEESALLISSDEECQFKTDDIAGQKPSLITCDFIPLQTNSFNDPSTKYSDLNGISQKFNRKHNDFLKVKINEKTNNPKVNIANPPEITEVSNKPKKKRKKKNSKIEKQMFSNTDNFYQGENTSCIVLSTFNEEKVENSTSTSGNSMTTCETAARKRKHLNSSDSKVLLEISKQLTPKSPGLKKIKLSSDSGGDKRNIPSSSGLASSRRKKSKKAKLNKNSKEQYIENKNYLARTSKRIKKKQLKQEG